MKKRGVKNVGNDKPPGEGGILRHFFLKYRQLDLPDCHLQSKEQPKLFLLLGEKVWMRAGVKANFIISPRLFPRLSRVKSVQMPGETRQLKSARHVWQLLQDCGAMRILALDHGTKRIGVAVSDETKTIAQPLEYIPAEPFADFLARLKQLLVEKEIDLVLVGLPRNMDGSYGPAALKVQTFIAVLKDAITVPIKTWDERLTSAQANRILIQGGVRRDKRKEKVDKMAAAILLQSYLDGL
jgi:putative holliday junction resolvase